VLTCQTYLPLVNNTLLGAFEVGSFTPTSATKQPLFAIISSYIWLLKHAYPVAFKQKLVLHSILAVLQEPCSGEEICTLPLIASTRRLTYATPIKTEMRVYYHQYNLGLVLSGI
jgi:hypothetical protein